jgi:hypothetical protein
LDSLSPWKKSYFGMNNTMKSSTQFLLTYHTYSSAYELEYSFHVIIMIYELAYSLDILILTCSTSCFNIHMTCMSRSRARVGVAVHRSFRVTYILACQSVELESRGDIGSFLVHRRGAWVHGNLWI